MSDEMIIDLSNYKDRVGSRVEPGRYRVQVEDAEPTESANKNPMINLWFRVIGTEFDGQTITDRLVLTDKSLFRVVGFMQAIGLPTPKKRLRVSPRQFIGQTLDVDVEDGEPYNGRVRSEVRGYYKIAKKNTDEGSLDGLDEFSTEPEATTEAATDLPEPETGPASGKSAAVETDEDGVELDSLNL